MYFLILLIPISAYIYYFGIRVIAKREVYIPFFRNSEGEKKVWYLQSNPVKLLGYTTIIGGIGVSFTIISIAFAEGSPSPKGFQLLILMTGTMIHITGAIFAFMFSILSKKFENEENNGET